MGLINGIELQGKTSFISQDGINQLNNFIFVLAMMQIVYSLLTMALGRAKVCPTAIIFLIIITSSLPIYIRA